MNYNQLNTEYELMEIADALELEKEKKKVKYYTVDTMLIEKGNLIEEWQHYSGYDLEKAKEAYNGERLEKNQRLELRVYYLPGKLDEPIDYISEHSGYDTISEKEFSKL